jgi:hypothetical protein
VPGEAIIVRNDGGLKFQTQVLDFGEVCHVNGWSENWLSVKRIVGDWTLIELVGPSPSDELNIDYPSSIVEECPLGTETTRPVIEMRARLNAYEKESESELIASLQSANKTKNQRKRTRTPRQGPSQAGSRYKTRDSRLRLTGLALRHPFGASFRNRITHLRWSGWRVARQQEVRRHGFRARYHP